MVRKIRVSCNLALEMDPGEQLGPKSGHLAISLPKAAFYEVGFRPFGTKNGLFGSKA